MPVVEGGRGGGWLDTCVVRPGVCPGKVLHVQGTRRHTGTRLFLGRDRTVPLAPWGGSRHPRDAALNTMVESAWVSTAFGDAEY